MARRLSFGVFLAAAAALVAFSSACAQSDAGITIEVKAKIDADRNLTSNEMQVDTKKGVVTLSGAAASDGERKRAEQLARATDGVKDVVDKLTINPTLAPISTDPNGNAVARTASAPTTDTTPPAPASTTPGGGQ
jgi:hypothetical protein